MTEGSGSVPLTDKSGSWRHKNMRIRIRNTVTSYRYWFLIQISDASQRLPRTWRRACWRWIPGSGCPWSSWSGTAGLPAALLPPTAVRCSPPPCSLPSPPPSAVSSRPMMHSTTLPERASGQSNCCLCFLATFFYFFSSSSCAISSTVSRRGQCFKFRAFWASVGSF